MTTGFGFIPNLCGTPVAQPPGGGTTVIDLKQSVDTAVAKLQEILEAINSRVTIDESQFSDLISRIQELIDIGGQPQVLPEDYSEILNNIRNILNEIGVTFPDEFADLVLETRTQIDRVVARFIEQNTADERRHTELISKLDTKLSVKKVVKKTGFKLIDARQFKIKVALPAGAIAWKVFPICKVGDQLVQDVAHSFVLDGEAFSAGEVASDEAVSVGSQIGVLEGKDFEFPAGSGHFRLVWSYLSNMPIQDVVMTTDDDATTAEIIDEGEVVADGETVDSQETPDASADDVPDSSADGGESNESGDDVPDVM